MVSSSSRAESAPARLQEMPVRLLKRVGPRMEAQLARLGIHSVQDLLFHLPLRYQDRTRILPIGSLRPGESAVVEGEVQHTEIKFGKRRMLLSVISDGTGFLTLRFFHFNQQQKERLARGVCLRCYGEVRAGYSSLEMTHPETRLVGDNGHDEAEEHLTPIYPATEGVQQRTLRDLSDQALAWGGGLEQTLPELLPAEVLAELKLPVLGDAIRFVHRPPPQTSLAQLEQGNHPALRRLAFEELLAHHLSLRQLRAAMQQHGAEPLAGDGRLRQRFLDSLPFRLTAAQRRVAGEVEADLARPHPMQRLVQGDVGSGKTVVAALACLAAVEQGRQAVLMAPTELLAEQHFQNFRTWLEPLGVGLAWLGGKLKGKARDVMLESIASGAAQIVVGTHALFQQDVHFSRLALVVIDEQHRFGVHQRLALREKGAQDGLYPHQLIMTATPIPRTLAMSVYADLDCSTIDELPPGRTPVETVVIPDSRRDAVVQRVRAACAEGRQAYWVCTLIEESETLQCEAAQDSAALLAEALPDLRVGLVHGRMKPRDKEQAMAAFKAGAIDLLVATTVIEVGVDVPNASLMIIENAERLGLAQLHQLRGRVGRGAARSSCVLMYHGPLSQQARERLGIMRETNDGFAIARKDLELRGPGEVLGTRQTGEVPMRIADLMRDQHMIPLVEKTARYILCNTPERTALLILRWLGQGARYGEV